MKTIKEGDFTATFPEDYKPGKQYNGKRTFGKRELNARCTEIQGYLKRFYDGDKDLIGKTVGMLRARAADNVTWFEQNNLIMAAYDQLPESIKNPITNKVFKK